MRAPALGRENLEEDPGRSVALGRIAAGAVYLIGSGILGTLETTGESDGTGPYNQDIGFAHIPAAYPAGIRRSNTER